MKHDHPFQNNGSCSGICTVCGDSMPTHEFVAIRITVAEESRSARTADAKESGALTV
jgi:hypothetical protein